MHTVNLDAPEVQGMSNPIGIVRVHKKFKNDLIVYCEHISSIPTTEKGYGFNHCGILRRFGN